MKTIHKHIIKLESTVTIQSHPVLEHLHVEKQRGEFFLWSVVDDAQPMQPVTLYVRGTGHPFTGDEGSYIGTEIFDGGALVFHVFAAKE